MTPQQILDKRTAALEDGGFAVHENDDHLPEQAPFPGDAIAYIHHDQVELYLLEGGRRNGLDQDMAADRAAKAIAAAGLSAGEDASSWLVTGRVTVIAA